MKSLIRLGIVAAFMAAATVAVAYPLTDEDFVYLDSQNVPKDSQVLGGLSPKEQARLHRVINDPSTVANPVTRAKTVHDVLAEFEGNQDWERQNPGQLWDVQKRRLPGTPPFPLVPN